MSKYLRKPQEEDNYSIESISYKEWVWLQKKDWDVADEQRFIAARGFLNTFRKDNDYPNLNDLGYRSSRSKRSWQRKKWARNTWILKHREKKHCLGWLEIEGMFGEFREARICFRLADWSEKNKNLVHFLISACFLGYRLDRIRILTNGDDEQWRMLDGFDFGPRKRILVGRIDGSLKSGEVTDLDKNEWWQRELAQRDLKSLSFLAMRVSRSERNERIQQQRPYVKPKKSGIIARFFGNNMSSSTKGSWNQWSKRDGD